MNAAEKIVIGVLGYISVGAFFAELADEGFGFCGLPMFVLFLWPVLVPISLAISIASRIKKLFK